MNEGLKESTDESTWARNEFSSRPVKRIGRRQILVASACQACERLPVP